MTMEISAKFFFIAVSVWMVIQMLIVTWLSIRIDILEKQVSDLHKEKKERYAALLAAREDFLKFLKADNNDLMA